MSPEKNENVGSERRRGARITSTFLLQVLGVETELKPRRGNISISGVFFETDQSLGSLGDVLQLRLAAAESGPFVQLAARIARMRMSDNIWEGTGVQGIAFEFLAQNDPTREKIRRIVKQTAELRLQRAKEIPLDFTVQPVDQAAHAADQGQATVRFLSRTGMVMETQWQVSPGEQIRVAVQVPNARRTIQLEGRAVRSEPNETENEQGRFTTEVQFVGDTDEDLFSGSAQGVPDTFGGSISDVVDQLLNEIIDSGSDAPQPAPEQSLRGSLAQISLPSLLGFLHMERRSGALHVSQDNDAVTVFLQEGTVLDMEPMAEGVSGVEQLGRIVRWRSGTFEFSFQSVDREDRIEMPTQMLLLEVARYIDEQNR